MSKGDPVAFWRKQFELGGNSVERWADKAYGLATAAKVLESFQGAIYDELMAQERGQRALTEAEYQRTSVSGVSAMLRAMAAECFLKALWLKQGNTLAKNGAYTKILNGNEHRLHELASAVAGGGAITFDADELKPLEFVSNWIVVGRYPIPRSFMQMSVLERDPTGRPVQRQAWIGEPEKQLCTLLEKLEREVGVTYSFAPDE
jgi:hypothetical protein